MENELQITEVKNVAVIVAAISRPNPGTDSLYPETHIQALRCCHQAVDSIVKIYNGMMNPLTGEQMTACFGLHENSGKFLVNAVISALDIRSRIEEMVNNQELPEGVSLRASITSGEAVLMASGSGKAQQSALIGNPVDLANRLVDVADPGQILVSQEIYNFTQKIFDYHVLDPIPVKGQRKPMAVCELVGKKRTGRPVTGESSRMISSILVGRDEESRILEEMIKQLLNGRGGVLNIEGVAGIGKSRLIDEARAMEITRNVLFFEGRALSEGKNLSFHPIVQIIKSWSGISEEDSPAGAFQKLSQNIMRIYPEQATEIVPFVATMMGYPLSGENRQRVRGIEGDALEKLILKNLRDLFSRAASINPIILLVEDAHWADLSSISFLESLFKLVKNNRLLFINVFRPGSKETGERMKAYLRENLPDHYREIKLQPLDQEESAELIRNLMNRTNLPEDIKSLVITRSEGNPFFIEEVIRSFIDEGLIEIKEHEFLVTEQIRYANIPETIDKVILSRIERLDEKTKNLLKTASVIGRNFYYKVLEEATQTIKELDSRLEYLTETQLLNGSKTKDDVEFLFKHALAHQATYDSILQNTRKNLHLKIAHSIEKVFADKINEFYGILAMHYGKAEVQEKKEEYLVKAGDEAFRSGASSEAMSFYLEAFKSMPHDPVTEEDQNKLKDLEIKIGFAQEAAGNNLEAIETFRKIIEKYFGYSFGASETLKKLRALRGMFCVICKLQLQTFFFRRQPDEKFETFMKVLTQWAEAMTSMNPRQLFFHLVYFLNKVANYDLSKSVAGLSVFIESSSMFLWTGLSLNVSKKILDYARLAGAEKHPGSNLDYRFILKMHEFLTGHFEDDPDYEHVFQDGMHFGEFWPVTIYILYSGMVIVELGNYERLAEYIKKLEEISDSFDNSHARAQAYRLSALAHYRFGKLDQALKISEEGIHYTVRTGHFSMLLVIWCARSLAYSALNEIEEAKKALSEAEKLVADRKIMTVYHAPYLQAKVSIELFELQQNRGQPGPNKARSGKIFATVNDLIRLSAKMQSLSTEAYRIKAMIYWILKKQHKAYRYFSLSIQAGQKYNATLELARTYFEVGKCLRESGSVRSSILSIDGMEYLLKARTLFEEMELQRDLQQYNKYMEG